MQCSHEQRPTAVRGHGDRGAQGLAAARCPDAPHTKAAHNLAVHDACAIRYPRDNVPTPGYGDGPAFEVGVSRRMRPGSDATILAYGSTVSAALDAAELLAVDGVDTQVLNARFAKPVDSRMLDEVLKLGHPVITVEDHTLYGGFGSAVLESAAEAGLPAHHIHRLGMPKERFIAQGSRVGQLAEVGIDAAGIAARLSELLETSAMEPERRRITGAATPLRPAARGHLRRAERRRAQHRIRAEVGTDPGRAGTHPIAANGRPPGL